MFKNPITKEGNLRYVEVVKYTVLIALGFALYTAFTSSVIMPVVITGVKLSSIFVIVLFLNVLLISTIEVLNLLRSFIIPIIEWLQTRLSEIEIIVTSIRCNYKKIYNTTSFKELSVFRCWFFLIVFIYKIIGEEKEWKKF